MQSGPQRSSSNTIWILLAVVAGLAVCCCSGGVVFVLVQKRTESVSTPVPVVAPPSSAVGPAVSDSSGSGAAGTPSVTVTMTITTATGIPGLTPGAVCAFPVVYHPDNGDLNCQAHVTCAGVALYGDTATNGFFPCVYSPSPFRLSGSDTGMTAADSDPSFVIDSSAGTVTVQDDSSGHHGAFAVTGRITSAQ